MSIRDDVLFCLKPRCPVCKKGALYRSRTISVLPLCAVCGAELGENDVGDGAAVFVMWLLCFSVVPLAWMGEVLFSPPLWAHVIVWTIFCLAMMFFLLPAVKAYIILLEYRHRRHDPQV